MFKLKLPILLHTEQTERMKEWDIEADYNNCPIETMTFYSINVTGTFTQNGRDWTEIHSNGDMFISPMLEKEIEKQISTQHNFTPN